MKKHSKLLHDLQEAFSLWPRPASMSKLNTREARQIEGELRGLDRDQMPYTKAANLIVDSALISDEAFCYFLPRAARAVLAEGGDALILLQRLRRLNQGALNAHQKLLLESLMGALEDRMDLLSQEEQNELEKGRREWRRRLLESGRTEDRLFLAVADGDLAVVEHLIDLGVDANAKDYNNNTALSIAEMYERGDIIALLKRKLCE